MTIMEVRKHGDAADGLIGGRHSRLDGQLKTTGSATYALEHSVKDVAHAVLVQSTIAAGRVVAVDAERAKAQAGVVLVLTPESDLGLKAASDWYGNRPENEPYHPLPSEVSFNGQAIAAVVAETLEQAIEAAKLVAISYEETPPVTSLDDPAAGVIRWMDKRSAYWVPVRRGDAPLGVVVVAWDEPLEELPPRLPARARSSTC